MLDFDDLKNFYFRLWMCDQEDCGALFIKPDDSPTYAMRQTECGVCKKGHLIAVWENV